MVLTYPIKHRKTYNVLSLLKANGYTDVKVFAIPFQYKKKKQPLIRHRPEMNFHVPDIDKLCFNLGYLYEMGDLENFHIEKDRIILIAGGGILRKNLLTLILSLILIRDIFQIAEDLMRSNGQLWKINL